MNYIIESGIDFYAELNKKRDDTSDDEDTDNDNMCLISGEKLSMNHIVLPCKHSFNYYPLYLEIISQKCKTNLLNIDHLQKSQIKCPYCRNISNKFLPYISSIEGVCKIKYVNCPDSGCMSHRFCGWKFKSGKHKNSICGNAGFETTNGDFCSRHWKSSSKISDTEPLIHLTVVKLKEMLRAKGLKVGGRKKDLIKRLQQS